LYHVPHCGRKPKVNVIREAGRLDLKPVLVAVAILFLSVGQVKADEYGSFDDSGNYNYYSGPGRPSLPDQPQPLYDYNRRAQEEADRQAIERNRQAYIDKQRRSSAVPSPAVPPRDELIYTPNGTVYCQNGFPGQRYCR
jgi:hypothetical protein